MQEDATVSFDPIYEGNTTWFQRLFVFYLFSVLLLTIYRATRVAWGILKLWKLEAENSSNEGSDFQAYWYLCHRYKESFKKFSHLTLLLSLLVLAMGSINVLAGVSTAKAPSVPYAAASMADAITPFSLAIVVCIVLYCCAMFFDAMLARRKSKRDQQP